MMLQVQAAEGSVTAGTQEKKRQERAGRRAKAVGGSRAHGALPFPTTDPETVT